MAKGDFLGEFEQVVLLVVARLDGDGYGVSIQGEIEARTRREVSVGAVYATLGRLESKGLVTSWKGTPTAERGGRAKRHFRILPEGERALARTREMFQTLWRDVDLGEADPA